MFFFFNQESVVVVVQEDVAVSVAVSVAVADVRCLLWKIELKKKKRRTKNQFFSISHITCWRCDHSSRIDARVVKNSSHFRQTHEFERISEQNRDFFSGTTDPWIIGNKSEFRPKRSENCRKILPKSFVVGVVSSKVADPVVVTFEAASSQSKRVVTNSTTVKVSNKMTRGRPLVIYSTKRRKSFTLLPPVCMWEFFSLHEATPDRTIRAPPSRLPCWKTQTLQVQWRRKLHSFHHIFNKHNRPFSFLFFSFLFKTFLFFSTAKVVRLFWWR